ncbi:hypothetical protein CXF68_07060 [Tenacibaculum sp. Bg11-29]|uniref:hypothetical protein n=1 Tax=Tenacibaculum sp. Bg11-29 TaxID=2058306 RepID=UPI000C337F38|nr:hypothetical protein [Tenacibaculum sp. Bg11-29]PKH50467.1 hypothetical protein CXF68_07060 [Tenacibaculum sp. Bg11-29]
MYKIAPFFLLLTIVFTSCSSNQVETLSNPQEKLLQSYTLKRDVNGAYSIDFNTTNNTDVVTVKNKSNDIILSEVNRKTASNHSNKFSIENDQLKIGFLDENRGKRTRISVEDDNITLAKGGVTEFLNSYNITKKEDGTFLLNFKVNDNVTTTFVYNEDKQAYEVHLSNGKSKQKNFSRTINTPSANLIRLDFVNHKYSGRSTQLASIRKPRVEIIVD